jgi:hypothetical protein
MRDLRLTNVSQLVGLFQDHFEKGTTTLLVQTIAGATGPLFFATLRNTERPTVSPYDWDSTSGEASVEGET